MQRAFKEVPLDKLKEEWENYALKTKKLGYFENGIQIVCRSYSHLFFSKFNLKNYLNTDCKKILQLGACKGELLKEFQENNWDVFGIDYSENAISHLTKTGIPNVLLDLNEITACHLFYEHLLQKHLERPTNIFTIRILSYLDYDVILLLLFQLIKEAKKGTVICIADSINMTDSTFQNLSKLSSSETQDSFFKNNEFYPNFLASFFAPRTDIKFLFHTHTPAQKHPDVAHNRDEVLVVRKL